MAFDIFDEIEGLVPVDPAILSEFQRTMNEEVIPAIVKDIQRRQELAKESQHWSIS